MNKVHESGYDTLLCKKRICSRIVKGTIVKVLQAENLESGERLTLYRVRDNDGNERRLAKIGRDTDSKQGDRAVFETRPIFPLAYTLNEVTKSRDPPVSLHSSISGWRKIYGHYLESR